MSLEPGQALAHYEILEPIGQGGMGVVYRAKDTKLGRDVAIKVLPDELAGDEERLRRFQREAKVLAALNHPNIASIHGLEATGGTHYLVLELVEGETLAERIARGPVPVDEAMAIATQLTDALEEAHARAIVHRDLKPANIKLAPDDRVKVLDFGLAKAFSEEAPETDSSMSPTITRDATRVGVILGTAAYMSPEQAKGKVVDKRTDIFAFGAVLYELLTGRKAFPGEDVSDTLAAVLRATPDLEALPPEATPALRTALARCLEKDPRKRLRDIGDVRLAMEGALESVAPASAAAVASSRLSRRGPYFLAITLALLTGLLVWAVSRRPVAPRPVARFVVTAPPSPSFFAPGEQNQIAISPSGDRVVYRAGPGGAQNWLYTRELGQLEAARLEETHGGASPFFSPDGAWLGFVVNQELKKMPASGGAPTTVASLTSVVRGASWGEDGTIVFATTRALYRISANGGEPELVLENALVRSRAGDVFRWPELLPGGRAVLFTIQGPDQAEPGIAVLDLHTSEVRSLLSPGTYPRYASTGHIVYAGGDGTLRAVPFDDKRLEVAGAPVTVVEGVETHVEGAAEFALSRDGTLVYAHGSSRRKTNLIWVDRTGRKTTVETEPKTFDFPRLSPDGRHVAVKVQESGSSDLYVLDLQRDTLTRLTSSREEVTSPMWSRDGKALVFGSAQRGGGLFEIAADGAGTITPLGEGFGEERLPLPGSWSHDGTRIVFYESGGPAIGDIFTLDTTTAEVEPLLASPDFQEAHPALSPDGRWLAFTGNDSGRQEIYVRPFPSVSDRRIQISPAGGNEPAWRADGREIYYWDDEARSMMAVPVTLEPSFEAGVATPLFSGDYVFYRAGRHYDVSADGQRFLMIGAGGERTESALDGQIIYIENWLTELERLVPTYKSSF